MFVIRPAVLSDAEAITQVHIRSWQTTYRGIMAQDALNKLSMPPLVEQRKSRWVELLSQPDVTVFVALDESGQIVGFADCGKIREYEALADSELFAIYLLDSAQGRGIGKRLFETVIKALAEQGYQKMLLWVIAENLPAVRFYEKMGGRRVGEQTFKFASQTLLEYGYVWDNLALPSSKTPD